MRWFHLSVIALFVGAVIVFAAQNLQLVTMSFLGYRATMPLALLAGIMYVLGMATGGSLLALLRWVFEGAKRHTTTAA